MSILRLTTLSNQGGTASVPSDTVINGTAKAWVNFNGTGTVAIRAAFNVSSITDNGVGDYTLNFATAIVDTNYSIAGFIRSDLDSPNNVHSLTAGQSDTKTTSALRVRSRFYPGNCDTSEIDVQIFR
jgi:hypothetical protein